MAYTFLDNSLNTIGVLTNKGGQTNDYWGDSITHEIATSQDVLTSVSLSVDKPSVNIDTSGNQKTWNHVIQGLSFNIDGIGRKVNENDYLIYQEGTNGKYYLMAITQVDESAVQSGFHYKTVQGLNAAAYDLSRKTLRAKSFAQIPDNTQEKGTAKNILKYIFADIDWDVRTIGSFGAIDYEIAEGTTAQAVLLDIIGMFEAEVDAYVKLNNWGKGANVFNKNGSIKRIFDFSTSLGKYRGETVRYNKNMVSITKTGARDSMYTKLYVNGNNITIADANKGADFIVDDVANRKYNKLGSVSTPVTYLEGIITNSAIESPTALLAWGKKQLKILNHPRYNYQISATNDDKVQLGDTVIIQDTHASDPIYLKSKVISKTVSLADPVNNSFIVGEFSPIVIGADNGLEDTNQIMQLVNQANQTAINAQNKANENAKKIVDTRTNLEKTIDDKLQEGQDYADSLNNKAIEEQTKFNNQINQELATAKSERDAFSSKADQMIVSANSYADTMYSNAVSTAKDEASKALTSANTALDEAKTDLTTNLNKETEDRNKAVSAVNSQAQEYADQAKSDAIEAANTADGQVRKDFKETTDALSSSISQNKEDSDGKISTAQSTATQALNGLGTKVSQTDYDKKTGDLSAAVNTVTQTATETKNELAKVSKTVGSQSAKINTISNTVDGTKQTISDIQTEQGKQSGSIATLQSRADGFDATVTKVNNLSVGVRNLLLGTSEELKTLNRSGWGNSPTNLASGTYSAGSYYASAYIENTTPVGMKLYVSIYAGGKFIHNALGGFMPAGKSGIASSTFNISEGQSFRSAFIGFESVQTESYTYKYKEMMITRTPTDWSPAPEDLSSATAKAQLTADNAALDLSTYKKDADGRISKAQSDITATANEVKTKVSQSDYNTTTGDLTTKYGQVKATADAVTTDVANYKKSNDGKVSANEAGIKTLNNQITSKVSQTDFNEKTGELRGNYTETQQTIKKISNTVTELQAKANAQGQINQLFNTEFKPDYSGWTINEPRGSHQNKLNMAYKGSTIFEYDSRTGGGVANRGSVWLNSDEIPINYGSPLSMSVVAKTVFAPTDETTGYFTVQPRFTLKDGSVTYGDKVVNFNANDNNTDWFYGKSENIQVPENTVSVCLYSWIRGAGVVVRLAQPMLVFDSKIGDYVAGNYNNNARVAELEIDLDGITGLVNDPKKGLSATAALAANGLSVATTAKNDAATATQTAKGMQNTVESFQGDMEDFRSTTTQTAKQVTDEIEDRKSGDKSVVTQTERLIDQRVKGVTEGYESAISQSADMIMLSVSTPNNIINSEFENDLELQNDGSGIDGWTIQNPSSGNGKPATIMNSNGYKNSNGLRINAYTNNVDTANAYYNMTQSIKVPHYVTQVSFNMMGYVYAAVSNSTTYINMNIEAKGPTGNRVGWIANSGNLFDTNKIGSWQEANNRLTNMTIPGGTDSLIINFYIRGRASVNFSQPVLTFTSKKPEYTRGPRNNLTTNSVLQLQSDYFSLNLHTNSKNIITSINGDRHGVTITGKHITLDGDVSVTGDFYAKGGNFKNINAANITTNVASFFKSGFNDAFGSYATLDSSGMQIATDRGVTQYSGQSAWFYNKNSDHNNVLESIGRIGSNKSPWTPKNVDYMEIAVSTWRGTNGKGNGGDGIMFAAYNPDMVETKLLTWETKLSAGYNKLTKGWNFWDDINFNGNKINVPSADWGVSFTGMTLGQTHSTYPSIVDANAHKTGISFGLHEVYLIIDGKSYPMSPKFKK